MKYFVATLNLLMFLFLIGVLLTEMDSIEAHAGGVESIVAQTNEYAQLLDENPRLAESLTNDPPRDSDHFWLLLLVTIVTAVNLLYVFNQRGERAPKQEAKRESSSWLILYLRRKAAEERQKLKALEESRNPSDTTPPR